MNKYWLAAVFALLSVFSGASQSINSFFYRHSYVVSDEYGRAWRTEKAINIIPLKGLDAQYEHQLSPDDRVLTSSYLVDDGNAFVSNWKTVSSVTHQLDYRDNAIYSVSQKTYNPISGVKSTNDRIVLIASPGESWKESQNGDKYECSADWVYLSNKSSVYKAIRVTKKLVGTNTSLDGGVQNSYWAEGLGLVLTELVTSDDKRKESYRINFDNVSFISEDQYIKQNAWNAFVDEQDQYVLLLRQLRENAYFFMQSEYYLAILEDAAKHSFSFPLPDGVDSQTVASADLPTRSIDYESIVSLNRNGVNENQSSGEPYQWFLNAYRRLQQKTSFDYPYVIEPVSGNKYYPKLRDTYTAKMTTTSYVLTFKKGKNGYVLKKGDEFVWEACREELQPYIADNKNQMDNPLDILFTSPQLRIIKCICGNHTAYYVVKKCHIDYGIVYCDADLLLIT